MKPILDGRAAIADELEPVLVLGIPTARALVAFEDGDEDVDGGERSSLAS